MKSKNLQLILLGAFLLGLTNRSLAMDPDLGSFLISKQQQIRDFAETITNKVPPVVWRFFDAVRVDDWETATNLAARINLASHRYSLSTNEDTMTPALGTLIWPPISESFGAYGQFHDWNNIWLHRFGSEIIKSIPPGSIYFGGTDPGRFVISTLCESQVRGTPFFTLTQNQLVDMAYLDYLHTMYGKRINIPNTNDLQNAFTNYTADVARRRKLGQLKPGEDVHMVGEKAQVSGVVAVMQINGRLVKNIFDENPAREFFVEESYPLDWMYPYLSPHGLIFQLNRQPLKDTFDLEVIQNQVYWKKLSDEALGGWLDDKTSVKEVCTFAEKYAYGKKLENYAGDKSFAENAETRKAFSKLRSAQAGLYAWRAQQATDPNERDRLNQAADLAFRQSYAICPYSPEAIYRYINLLLSRSRFDDAILIAKTSVHLDPDNEQFKHLLNQIMTYRR